MALRALPVISPATYSKFNACVHCGLCLPACPTYVETLDEADSPRGRILLMKAAVDGRVGTSAAVFEHLDRCLVCRACETACPSGVQFHDLMESVRPLVAEAVLGRNRHVRSGMLQWVVGHVLPYPKRMAAALGPLRLAQRIGLGGMVEKWMPGAGDLAEAAGEGGGGGAADVPRFTPAVRRAERRGSVILLRGCVGSVVSGAVNRACIRVLSRNGFDVHVLAREPCCGALAAHANDPQAERAQASNLVDVVTRQQADYIISPIAGCSAQLKCLGEVLKDAPAHVHQAHDVAERARDICEFLVEVGIQVPLRVSDAAARERTVTYHDPCHLAHAQRITAAPRRLLAMIPGLRLVEMTDGDMCCGAAGPYSLNQPELAGRLGARKVGHILETGAEEILTANVGCALQITRHLRMAGREMRVRHVVEAVAELYGDMDA
jgi:glycolate oxidase iron-sulfur subunit